MNGVPLSMFAFLILQVVFGACIFWVMPAWSRMELLFSMTVRRGFRGEAEGRAILSGYRWGVILSAIVSLIALFAASFIPSESMRMLGMILSATLLGFVGYTVAYLKARKRVMPHAVEPSQVREAALATDVSRGLTRGQWVAFLLPIALMLVAIAVVVGLFPGLPERIPTHFNAAGEPDAWSDKSLGMLLFPLGLAVTMALSLLFVTRWILRSLPVRTADADALILEQRRRKAIVELMAVVNAMLATVFTMVTAAMISPPDVSKVLTIVVLVVCFGMGSLLMVWFLVRHGSAFTAVHRGAEAGTEGSPIGDRTDDRFWKAGLIYYNPEDPAVWVEKRLGIGYTTNMARSEAWVMLGGIFVFTGLIIAAALAFGG